jgi:hypothetical protein
VRQGRTLTELAAEIDRQANAKADYIAPTTALQVQSNGHTDLVVMGTGRYEVNETAHQQIGEHLEIPRKYYQRLREEHPALLDENVNTLLAARPATERQAESYDRSSDLEALGGAILALPKNDMQALVAAR